MTTVTFDTLTFARRLKAAGIPEQQADAIAEAQRDAFAQSISDTLATKSDLKADIADMKFELLKWIIGLSLAQFALLLGLFIRHW